MLRGHIKYRIKFVLKAWAGAGKSCPHFYFKRTGRHIGLPLRQKNNALVGANLLVRPCINYPLEI